MSCHSGHVFGMHAKFLVWNTRSWAFLFFSVLACIVLIDGDRFFCIPSWHNNSGILLCSCSTQVREVLTVTMVGAAFRRLEPFDSDVESIVVYLEWVQLYFKANGIKAERSKCRSS